MSADPQLLMLRLGSYISHNATLSLHAFLLLHVVEQQNSPASEPGRVQDDINFDFLSCVISHHISS
jgi:hypothetical protein